LLPRRLVFLDSGSSLSEGRVRFVLGFVSLAGFLESACSSVLAFDDTRFLVAGPLGAGSANGFTAGFALVFATAVDRSDFLREVSAV
jgi:hypothetical protein